jgi:glycerol-3-phosphate acyltransferase PlsY
MNYYVGMTIVVIISYLLGSIPTAYIIAKLRNVNIFTVGSGNMGATNVGRALGTKWGVLVLLCDMTKGIVAIYVSQHIMPESKAAATTISAISVIAGHNWSLFATLLTGTLRGGKGAATALGTLIMVAPVQVILIPVLVGLGIVAITRYVSLGVLTTFLMAYVWMFILILQKHMDSTFLIYAAVLTALLLLRFRENIQRLLTGTERRFGEHA